MVERKGVKLPEDFYLRDDVVQISRDLLGKFLYTKINGIVTGGMITETEAYRAPNDRASHAYNMRRTARTETMFMKGGTSYVYLCYGIHSLFNVVTNKKEMPHAVLVRALEPTTGIETQLLRRKQKKVEPKLTSGPGALSQALGITRTFNALSLQENDIWIEDKNILIKPEDIIASPRIGIDYAGEDAKLPWRFYIRNNLFVSKKVKEI